MTELDTAAAKHARMNVGMGVKGGGEVGEDAMKASKSMSLGDEIV